MKISGRGTGRTIKEVTVYDIRPGDADDAVIDFAIAAAGETRSRLFGFHLDRDDDFATVYLYTD